MEEVGFDTGGDHADFGAGSRSTGPDLAGREFADGDDARAQGKYAPFDRGHVASQQVANQGSRLDPFGVELRMKQEHERRPRHDARPAEGERGVVRTGHGHVVFGLQRLEREGRPEQIGEVAHRRVRPANGVQVITHAVERREMVVQPRS